LCGDRAGVCRVLPAGLYSGSIAFSSEVDTGSRQENASSEKRVGENMNSRSIANLTAGLGAALFAVVASSPTSAQSTFKNYQCADGTQFVAGFFRYDSRAHLQLGGHQVTLKKGLALSGSRYTGRGITLKITKAGLTTLKQAKRPVTACAQT
jgi:membrane-bound inhibitor of C-type lysozyme